MSASGSLATIGVAELLQIGALFRKRGSLVCTFKDDRSLTVYLQDGHLSGLTDTGSVWQLGDLLECMGLLSEAEKFRLLAEARLHGKRLGQLLLEEEVLSRTEMEDLLRRLIMQSLLYAVENEADGWFEFELGAVSETSVMFPINDFLIEITSAVDELERLRSVLGPGGGCVALSSAADLTDHVHALPYRLVQVLAHVDGEKTPMEVAASSPFSPSETLRLLSQLGRLGLVVWAAAACEPEAEVVFFLKPSPEKPPARRAKDRSSPVSPLIELRRRLP